MWRKTGSWSGHKVENIDIKSEELSKGKFMNINEEKWLWQKGWKCLRGSDWKKYHVKGTLGSIWQDWKGKG